MAISPMLSAVRVAGCVCVLALILRLPLVLCRSDTRR
jgi:hypothetical protein